MCRRFRHGVGATGTKGRFFASCAASRVSKALTGPGVVEADGLVEKTYRFKQIQRADGDTFERLHRLLERQADRALPDHVVDLLRIGSAQQLEDVAESVS